jgi:transposase-like protein
LHTKVQAKLLRVLDGISYFRLGGSRKIAVDLRVIAATNRNLEEEVETGQFRRDLYHRLTNVQLYVPPLRERPEDVAALAEHFLGQQCPGARFTKGALDTLQKYSWPGNVRELQNAIFKMALNAKPGATQIDAHDLPPEVCGMGEASGSNHVLEGSLGDMEKKMIFQALERNGGNQTEAARQLGISSRTLRRKLDRYRTKDGFKYKGVSVGMLNELQQRYYRVDLETPVLVTDSQGSQLRATSVNVSCGGIAVRCSVRLEQNATFEVAFSLPGIDVHFEAEAKLAWTSPDGSAGLSFVELHPVLEQQLRRWVLERAQENGWSPTHSAGD